MLVVTQCHVDAALRRYDDVLAEAARARLITAATQPLSSATPRRTGRIRASLHQAVASLVARRGRLSAGAPS